MLQDKFDIIYRQFRLELYRRVFLEIKEHEPSITVSEYFCAESIYLLGTPTVNEFSEYLGISPSNAAYKVKQLIEKGYVRKLPDSSDGRSSHLQVTEKFSHFYTESNSYGRLLMQEIESKLDPKDVADFERVLGQILETVKFHQR